MIEIKNLYKKYIREYFALYDINLKINDGESVALVGEQNSGKTTLLRILAKLEKFDKGEVYVNDISVKKIDYKHDVQLGYLPCSPVFFENKTVYDNFKYVLKERKIQDDEIEDRINKALIEFNIEKLKLVKVNELTLFEKYLVSIVRLSLRELEIILVDNIFVNLNEQDKQTIISILKYLFVDKKITTLIATEDEKLLKGICKKVIHFKSGSIV